MRGLDPREVAAVFRIPPHLVTGERVRLWRARAVLTRLRLRLVRRGFWR